MVSTTARLRRRTELGLLTVGSLVIIFAVVLASIAMRNNFPANFNFIVIGLIAVICFVQGVNRWLVPEADAVFMPVVLVLNGLGCVMIECLDPSAAPQQVVWTVAGLVLYAATLYWIKGSRDLERYRYLMLFAAIILLILPLAPVIGHSPNNADGVKLWIQFHGLSLQPVEFAKILLVLFFASYMVEKRELLTLRTRRIGAYLFPDLRAFGPLIVGAIAALLIIIAERDIGFSLLLFLLFLALIWVTTGRRTYVFVGLALFVIAAFVASRFLPQVHERVLNWLNPWAQYNAPNQPGYQPVQAELAFGRGGLAGSGLGLGVVQNPQALPVDTSDYIFAAIGEELGLFGATAVLCAYLLFAGCGIRVAQRARSEFARLAALGLTLTVAIQSVIIMAGVTRLLPDTGLTLPFVSYGGSSLLANYLLIALLMRISHESNSPDEPDLFDPALPERALDSQDRRGIG